MNEHRHIKKNNNLYYNNSRPEIVELIEGHNNIILDVGCGAGGLADSLKNTGRCSSIYGIEIDEEASAKARTLMNDVYNVDLNQIRLAGVIDKLYLKSFDYIICADILEHLIDPYMVVTDLIHYLKPGGKLIISIPNVRHWTVLVSLVLRGKWDYQCDGILDMTHLRFFTKSTAVSLVRTAGLKLLSTQGLTSFKGRMLNRITFEILSEFVSTQYVLVSTID